MKLSSIFSLSILMVCISFTIRHLDTASTTHVYDEFQFPETANTSYLLFMLPPPNYTNGFSVVQLNVSSTRDTGFVIEAELTCQWYARPKQSVLDIQLFGHTGVNRLFSTGLFSYDAILSQIHISGDISLITSIQILNVLGNPDFFKQTLSIRWILAISSALCFFFYFAALLLFSRGRLQVEQLLSIAAPLIAFWANLPFEFSEKYAGNMIAHYLSALSRGLLSSYNTVALFLFALGLNGGEIMGFSFLMSLLFIMGNTLQSATGDTRVLKVFFDGNLDVWMFFVSISVIGRITLFILQIYQIFSAYHWSSLVRKSLIKGYALLVSLQIGTLVLQAAVYFARGFGNFALDFFGDYLLQTFFAFMFVDIHWPQIPPQRKLPLKEQLVELEDLRFPAVEENSKDAVRSGYCV
jgi:hypothetical protein